MRFNESCRFPVSLFGELPCESDLTQSEREKRREKRPKGLTEGHRGDELLADACIDRLGLIEAKRLSAL